jgi:uncharacterized protein
VPRDVERRDSLRPSRIGFPTALGHVMQIYLPIAELSVNLFVIFAMGGAVGFLSGIFGVGGGFLLTPLLIFSGVSPAVAVGTQASQIAASSVSGAIVHWRRRAVDLKLGLVLLIGGVAGSLIGIWLFSLLRSLGQIDLIISLSYVTFLGIIGALMMLESIRAIVRAHRGEAPIIRRPGQHTWVHGLPFKMRFKRSGIYVSAVPVIGIGAIVGLLAAVMGIGGGFIMVPALIYILRVPTNVVIGTSLFQVVMVTALVTILHATTNQTVDMILAIILMTGGVIGAQFGAQAGQGLKGEQLRALLALMVLGVCTRLAVELVATPDELFSLSLEVLHP